MNHILRRGPFYRRRALLLPCSISLSDHPPTTPPASHPIASLQASPFSRRDGLSLMQIYNHFICRCLPRTACRNIAQHHASKMSSLTQAASLASSQSPPTSHIPAEWRLMPPRVPLAAFCPSERASGRGRARARARVRPR